MLILPYSSCAHDSSLSKLEIVSIVFYFSSANPHELPAFPSSGYNLSPCTAPTSKRTPHGVIYGPFSGRLMYSPSLPEAAVGDKSSIFLHAECQHITAFLWDSAKQKKKKSTRPRTFPTFQRFGSPTALLTGSLNPDVLYSTY